MLTEIAVTAIRFYQKWISPMLGKNCRFYPTCSQYTLEAIEMHGILIGSWLGLIRIMKCGPWHPGGYDPVPDFPLKRKISPKIYNSD
ncbi:MULTISPECIES: membrane protein insertion efficiency factor YidD [Aminobacterium]|jgi:putative membrane protein insertion efficiency factor|uniref:Putative membrane protein insertion efficiency factor n=1 Tax=Aminobacterium colombiense (strain DSM 12261 / ALA-1) TaxID=572547 RepID=D5EE46_AMICL|nr:MULTISPECIES: membrane protein insertion efficiency factor YidD [Aminobacterium]MDD2378683.1 membrane protein insertion efficiency factor YidD [Aminobacterium colombiense]ADE56828.1 protein of unknown function DUF37 [Aminobacterium colombiense DSM 12261]MDD3768296.1 membrane protein insertion efficiency factor YidD [Aminobacterium colombiense]MDD4264985.1 membrane protein insertion efficiency factor YidD [Aminobacterium colombiense]MDD4585452.1 membrane protein insertion efficiency factor Y